jgi:hypothetical protein
VSILDKLLGRNKTKKSSSDVGFMSRIAPKRHRERPAESRKVWYMLSLDGHSVLTPWAAKEKRRRRASNRAAKQARKVNRQCRATGGLR